MTRKRNDNHSTEFGLWIREQEDIDSKLGFVASNLDYIWTNYKTGQWLLIEEKRYMSPLTYSQKEQFKTLDKICKLDKSYKGFYVLMFENTSPEDGKIFLNNKELTKDELIDFLKTFKV